MTITSTQDQDEFVDQIVHVAKHWLGPMPVGCERMDPLPERLDGFVFSLFPELEGFGGLRQCRLTPKGAPDVNLVEHHLHDTWPIGDPDDFHHDNPHVEEFLENVARVLRVQRGLATVSPVPPCEAMGRLAAFVFRLIEDGYELRPQFFDEDGEPEGEGDDIAPGLVAAFEAAWAERGQR